MVNCLFLRREQYQKEQRIRRKKILGTALPAFGVCVALLGIGLWNGQARDAKEEIPQKTLDAILSQTEESSAKTNETNDIIEFVSMVQVEGVKYVQCSTIHEEYTPDEYLGNVGDFEGSYQIKENSGSIYTVKENVDYIMVKLDDGEIALLIKEVK